MHEEEEETEEKRFSICVGAIVDCTNVRHKLFAKTVYGEVEAKF